MTPRQSARHRAQRDARGQRNAFGGGAQPRAWEAHAPDGEPCGHEHTSSQAAASCALSRGWRAVRVKVTDP